MSQAQPNPIQECLAALDALYNHQDKAVKDKANTWLTEFQRKPQAWTTADQILQRPGLSQYAYFYSSNTLRTKLQLDFADLSTAQARRSFRDSLLNHCVRFKDGPQVVRTGLAVCMATVAVHLAGCDEWPNAASDLCSTFGKPETALLLLDIMTVLPEECGSDKIRVSDAVLRRASAQLAPFGERILAMLLAYLKTTGSDRNLQKKVFACLLSWVRQDWLPINELAVHPLFASIFEALLVPELFNTCCDLVCELVRLSEDVARFSKLVPALIPRVIAMATFYDKAVREDDEDDAKSVSRVFIEMGEAYIQLITQRRPEILPLLDIILRCSAHSSKDLSSNTFNFWYLLQREIHRPENQVQRQELLRTFAPYFAKLLDMVRGVMTYSANYETWDSEKKDDAKRYRYSAAETLLDIAGIIGASAALGQIYQAMAAQMNQYLQNPKMWHGLEACLYCVRSIARKVDNTETEYIPKILELLPRLTEPHLRYTGTLIVGRYSAWIAAHPPYVKALLGYVVGGLNHPEVASSAALAFKFVCDGCAAYLAANSLESLFAVYLPSRLLPLDDQKEIIEGLTYVVCALPQDQMAEGLKRLIQPVATELGALVKSEAASAQALQDGKAQEAEGAGVAQALDRLAEIFKTLTVVVPMPMPSSNGDGDRDRDADDEREAIGGVMCGAVSSLWPLLEAAMNKYKDSERLVEKLCRCLKYALKGCGRRLAGLMQPLATLMAACFNRVPHPPLVYLLGVVAETFAKDPKYHSILATLLNMFTAKVLTILKDSQSFREDPCLVEDYFETLSRIVKECPDVLLNNAMLPQIFQMSLLGVHMQHYNACFALMNFYTTLILSVVDNPRVNAARGRSPAPEHVRAVQALMAQYGQALVIGLVTGIAREIPQRRVKYAIGVVEALLELSRAAVQPLFVQALSKLPDMPSKQQLLQTLFDPSAGAIDIRAQRDALSDFATACRRMQ